MELKREYDVVIAGASIAGCTAAILYGRAGLRVAVVERRASMDAYKAMCGHFILGGTKPTLERLKLWNKMLGAGAQTSLPSVYVDGQWMHMADHADVPPSITLRRSKLDPMLRADAAATPGVDLLLGRTVTGVVEDGNRVTGLVLDDGAVLRGRLVVGADGHRSPVAGFAGVPADTAPNGRFLWWAYYEGLDGQSRVWNVHPDAAVAVPAGDGLTLVGAFFSKERAGEFAEDRVAGLEQGIAKLPDAPDLSAAVRVSPVFGTGDYPFVRRDPAPRPGLALIGDAATASDPVPAVGCGWAFRSAEWLVDATADALARGGNVDKAVRRYRAKRKVLDRYDKLARAEALLNPPNAIQQAVMAAVPRDPVVGRRMALFAMRAAAPSVLLNPVVVARALVGGRKRRSSGAGEAVQAERDDLVRH